MENLTQYFYIFTLTEWLMLGVVAVLVMSLFSFNRQRKIQQQQSISMQSLQRDLRALANAAVGVGGRVLELERNQRKRPAIVSSQEPLKTDTIKESYHYSNEPYDQAIRMAQTGSSVDDIVNICGISKSEAELVIMMHRLDKAS